MGTDVYAVFESCLFVLFLFLLSVCTYGVYGVCFVLVCAWPVAVCVLIAVFCVDAPRASSPQSRTVFGVRFRITRQSIRAAVRRTARSATFPTAPPEAAGSHGACCVRVGCVYVLARARRCSKRTARVRIVLRCAARRIALRVVRKRNVRAVRATTRLGCEFAVFETRRSRLDNERRAE